MDQGKAMSSRRQRLPSLGSNVSGCGSSIVVINDDFSWLKECEDERMHTGKRLFFEHYGFRKPSARLSTRGKVESTDRPAAIGFTGSIHEEVESDAGANTQSKADENEDQNQGVVQRATTQEDKPTSSERRKHSRRSKDRKTREKRSREGRGDSSNKDEIHSENKQPADNGVASGGSIAEEGKIQNESAERKKSVEASADVSIRIGPAYRYDEHTGLLSPPGEGDGIFMKSTQMFVENAKTGLFRRVEESKWNGQATTASKKKSTTVKPGRVSLSSLANSSAQVAQKMSVFVQGLLGGWSALNLFLIHVWGTTRIGTNTDSFLKYYAPVALTVNRIYSSLISVALVLSFSRYSHFHTQPGRFPFTPKEKRWDGLVIVLYLIAYISSVLCTPLEDEIQHLAGGMTSFDGHEFHGGVFSKMEVWNAVSIARMVSSLLAWIMVCWGAHSRQEAGAFQSPDSIGPQNRLPSAGQML